jgi:hypothetical protein
MTQLVTVQTDFRDLEEMAHGLVGRVHGTHVILPTGDEVDKGEWAQFEITLSDGRAGLAGLGRCVTIVDNGEERQAHQRFDVVFDSLQFDTHEQRVFDHILAVHGEGGQPLEQVSDADAESLPPAVSEDSYVDVSTEFTGSAVANTVSVSDLDEGEQTMVASADELESVISSAPSQRSAMPSELPGAVSTPVRSGANGGYGHAGAAAHALHHSLHDDAFEEPVSGERIAPTRPMNGSLFAYPNGIPFPATPPRPDLDASLRVTPAPRPGRSGGH